MSIRKLDKAKEILEKYLFEVNDPWDIVDGFEKLISNYCGSKYGIALDSCTNAIFLCLYFNRIQNQNIQIPSRTYLSVPQSILRSGNKPVFADLEWSGLYQLGETNIYDCAGRLKENMYIPNSYMCFSFHLKKTLPIGKGGMILTDSKEAYKWMYLAVYEGRDRRKNHDLIDDLETLGWNMYMTPEQAAYGIELFESFLKKNDLKDVAYSQKYKDLSDFDIFKKESKFELN